MEFEILVNYTAMLISTSSPETNPIITELHIQWGSPAEHLFESGSWMKMKDLLHSGSAVPFFLFCFFSVVLSPAILWMHVRVSVY